MRDTTATTISVTQRQIELLDTMTALLREHYPDTAQRSADALTALEAGIHDARHRLTAVHPIRTTIRIASGRVGS